MDAASGAYQGAFKIFGLAPVGVTAETGRNWC